MRDTSPFLDLADAVDSATGEPLYPHDLRTQADAADAVTLVPDERQTARAVEALVQFTTAPPAACRP